jgi:hypothetical protein
MKEEVISSSDESVIFYRTTRRHIPNISTAALHGCRRDEIKPSLILKLFIYCVTKLLGSFIWDLLLVVDFLKPMLL